MTNTKSAALLVLAGTLFAGSSTSPDVKMRGAYVNENQQATLEVTSDKIVVSGGPLTIKADYKVVSVSGGDVTVELTAQGTTKGNMVITVRDDSLLIKDSFLFGGTWRRK